MEKKPKKKVQTHGQGLGRGLAGDMGLNFLSFFVFFVFWFFHGFLQFGQNLENTKKTKKNKKFRPMGKVWAIHTQTKKPKNQKNKKPKNQETKKPKNLKNKKPKKTNNQKTKKTKKTKIAHPKGRGSDAECWVLSFCFFCFFGFLVFWFVDSHCRCAKQRLPGTVSGCTRSKVDTLQYSNVCYDIVHSANEQQRGMEFNFVRLRHMLLDLCTGNAAICALPQWPVLEIFVSRKFVSAISRLTGFILLFLSRRPDKNVPWHCSQKPLSQSLETPRRSCLKIIFSKVTAEKK